MPKIIQLSPHVANLIAAGEVVERPASVVKELLENAVDAGASKVTVELRNGGMTFLRVTDDGCGMTREDARTAFLRHATSKLREPEDLNAIGTMGFRGEALAAIAAVSRVDLLTKTAGAVEGTSLHLEAGEITAESEAGCPEGTTMMVRDLFFNTPARMKFMKQDSVEGAAVAAAVQRQALAHPQVAVRLLRDGKEILNTPGDGRLLSAMAGVYGREAANLVPVDSHWESSQVQGFVSKPTQARASRAYQIFFVNGRPVKSKLLQSALEEAYRNQLMVGKFPACVLHVQVPPHTVDVNVHPAKTEVKVLSEREAFDCVHYGVLAALNKTQDRPQLHLDGEKPEPAPAPKKQEAFQTMPAETYRQMAAALAGGKKPDPERAQAAVRAMERAPLAQPVFIPRPQAELRPEPPRASEPAPVPAPPEEQPEPVQAVLPMPEEPSFTVLGELFRTYIVVQQGEEAFLIDKHAAHERVLFDKLRAQKQEIASQTLLAPQVCRLGQEGAALVLEQLPLLDELGYGVEEFGEGTVLLRQAPMDLSPEQAADCLTSLVQDLQEGKREDRDGLRDHILHTMACKAAIKAGWHTDSLEREALVREVLGREDLKYCPHGRPVCIRLTKQQLERQFGRA